MSQLVLVVVLDEVVVVQPCPSALSVVALDRAVQPAQAHFAVRLLVESLAFAPAMSSEVLLGLRRQKLGGLRLVANLFLLRMTVQHALVRALANGDFSANGGLEAYSQRIVRP